MDLKSAFGTEQAFRRLSFNAYFGGKADIAQFIIPNAAAPTSKPPHHLAARDV